MSDEAHQNDGHGHGGGGGHSSHGGHGGGHGGGEHEESGAPEWLISFADNTALIMGFFVILLAMNMGNPPPTGGAETESEVAAAAGQTAAALDWAIAVREAFNNPVDPFSTDPRDRLLVARLRELRERSRDEGASSSSSTIGPNLTHETVEGGSQFTLDSVITFDVGSSMIRPEEHPKLQRMAQIVAGHRKRLIVRGHAFGQDVPNARGLDYRDLSYERAKAVATYLEGVCGLRSDAIVLEAMGQIDPREVRNYTASEQAENRRVEVILTEIPIDERDPDLNFTEEHPPRR